MAGDLPFTGEALDSLERRLASPLWPAPAGGAHAGSADGGSSPVTPDSAGARR